MRKSGFDFNELVQQGIRYFPADSLERRSAAKQKRSSFLSEEAREEHNVIRSIFHLLLESSQQRSVPIIVHNGLLDLMFMYHAFYAPLPEKLETFTADLSLMFPGGIYDTKYVSDYISREPISFLAYLYHKYKRQQERNEAVPCRFTVAPPLHYTPTERTSVRPDSTEPYCQNYALHGHCRLGDTCVNSHDLDTILDYHENPTHARKKHKKHHSPHSETEASPSDAQSSQKEPTTVMQMANDHPHTAAFDAFMTAFVFMHQKANNGCIVDSDGENDDGCDGQETGSEGWKNRIYLIGKQFPLLIEKSPFVKSSAHHQRLSSGKK